VDVTGYAWETIWDIASLGASVAEVVANPTDPWAWAGLVGDVVDLVPFVTGVGETTKAVKTAVQVISDVDDVVDSAKNLRKVANATSDVKKSVGTYVILYENGMNYVGKGGFNRAIISAEKHLQKFDKVKAIIWAPTKNTRNAFVSEYFLQTLRIPNKNNFMTFNRIWSPEKNMY